MKYCTVAVLSRNTFKTQKEIYIGGVGYRPPPLCSVAGGGCPPPPSRPPRPELTGNAKSGFACRTTSWTRGCVAGGGRRFDGTGGAGCQRGFTGRSDIDVKWLVWLISLMAGERGASPAVWSWNMCNGDGACAAGISPTDLPAMRTDGTAPPLSPPLAAASANRGSTSS